MNQFPKLHNAAWPGVVGKGSPGAEPFIDLDTMLDLTANANMNGVRFDGVEEQTYFASDALFNDIRVVASLRLAGVL